MSKDHDHKCDVFDESTGDVSGNCTKKLDVSSVPSKTQNGIYWKVNTAGLFNEILTNNNMSIFRSPLNIMRDILVEIAERSAELDDPKLLLLCSRLALYGVSDPYCEEYNSDVFDILEKRIKALESDKK